MSERIYQTQIQAQYLPLFIKVSAASLGLSQEDDEPRLAIFLQYMQHSSPILHLYFKKLKEFLRNNNNNANYHNKNNFKFKKNN